MSRNNEDITFSPGRAVVSGLSKWERDQVSGHTMPYEGPRRPAQNTQYEHTVPVDELSGHTIALGNLASAQRNSSIETSGQVDLVKKGQFERYLLRTDGVISVDASTVGLIPEGEMTKDCGVRGKTSLIIDLAPINDGEGYSESSVFIVDRGAQASEGRFLVAPYKEVVEEWRFGPQGLKDLDRYVQEGRLWMFDAGQSTIVGRGQRGVQTEGLVGIPIADTSISRRHFEIQFDLDAISVANLKDYTFVTANPVLEPK